MIRNVLSYLLIALIVACPFLCRSGVCSLADDCCARFYGAQECCDEHAHEGQSDQHPATPNDNAPCGFCQCICGGAVIEPNDDDVTQQMNYTLQDAVVTSDSLGDLPFPKEIRPTLVHDHKISAGRFLCVLHMSFLL